MRLPTLLFGVALLLGAGASPAVRAQYEKRLSALKEDDVKGLAELARWCLDASLRSEGEALYRRILEREPDHPSARKALGYVKTDGTWLTQAEHRRRKELAELTAEADRLPPGDVQGRLRTARKALAKGHRDLSQALFRRIVETDPEHAEARRGLAQTKFEGAWKEDRELAAAYLAEASEEKRAALAAVLGRSGSEYGPARLAQLLRMQEQPRGKVPDLPLEGKGYTTTYILDVPPELDLLTPAPLVVFLHGGGTAMVVEPEQVYAFSTGTRGRGWISAFPKCPDQPKHVMGWNRPEAEAAVLEMIRQVSSRYPVDPRRIYLAGSSMGGGGTLWIGGRNTERFAALGALAAYPGGADPSALRNIPVGMIHGSEDNDYNRLQKVRELDSELTRLGSEHKLTILPGVGHKLPEEAYAQILDWFAAHVLPDPPGRR